MSSIFTLPESSYGGKFFLTGGSGILGTELLKHLSCVAPVSSFFDITKPNQFIGFGAQLYSLSVKMDQLHSIIHCAAYTDVPGAETNNRAAIEANILGTQNIADFGRSNRIVYISTDYVYPGIDGNYREDSRPEPFNFYGFTKLAGEAFMDPDKDLIIRTSFKPNDLWESKYKRAFVDIYTSADYVDIIAKYIAMAIDSDLTGIINIGTDRKSVYDLACKRYPDVGILRSYEIDDTVKMPKDASMNVDKFKKFMENNNV